MLSFEFIQATAALFSVAFLANLIQDRFSGFWQSKRSLFSGLKYGFIGLFAMLSPLVIAPGVQYDIRGPLIMLAGIFGGWIGATVAALGPLSYRTYLGGTGVLAGTFSILSAMALGIALNYVYATRIKRYPRWHEFIFFGFVCTLATLVWTQLLPSDIRLQVLLDHGITIVGVYVTATAIFGMLELQNISQRKARTRLTENARLMESAQQIGQFGFALLDLKKSSMQLSSHLQELLCGSIGIGEISTEGFIDFYIAPSSRTQVRKFVKSANEGKVPEPIELDLGGNGNARRPAWVHFVGWADTKTRARAVLIFQDVSDKVGLFEQMSHNARLATLGETATSIGHEIVNPLSAAKLSTERLEVNILAGKGNESSSLDLIRKIESRLNAITSLVKSISLFARVETSPKTPLSVHDVTYQTIELFKEINGAAAPKIDIDLGATDDYIVGRHLHLQQVLLNLLNNAQHALKDVANPKIQIVSDNVDNTLRLSVIDNGAGIPQDVVSKIFRPFFTTKAPGKGTGLGLSIVDTIVRDVGGRIEVESKPGEMTGFHIYFPLHKPESEAHFMKNAPKANSFEGFAWTPNPKI